MNIKINQRIKKIAASDLIIDLKSFKKNLDLIGKESIERVRSELEKSGQKFKNVIYEKISKQNEYGIKIIISTQTETIDAEKLVKITKLDKPVPLGLINEQMQNEEEEKIAGIDKDKELINRMVNRILNEVFYKHI